MKTLLLNLPYEKRLMRRFVASYFAPNFLMPPLELMYIGAIIKEWKKGEVMLMDAMAEKKSLKDTMVLIKEDPPKILVSMTGFNSIGWEMEALLKIKAQFPDIIIILLGYLPTQFPEKLLNTKAVDVILLNEPEETFSELYDSLPAVLNGQKDLSQIKGIAFRANNQITINPPRLRITQLDFLPFPDYQLIKLDLYNESYLGRPIATILSARGCRFQCDFCVRYYGPLIQRSSTNVLEEIQALKKMGIRNFRFMDDTFTLNKQRLIQICTGMTALNVRWTCLTRLDCLNDEMLHFMKQSGCVRIYTAIESGSQRVLDYYHKKIDVKNLKNHVQRIQNVGIEISAFFIVGAVVETQEDIDKSIQLARELNLDYIIVTQLQYWPGTKLFEKERKHIDFNLLTPKGPLYHPHNRDDAVRWQKQFYREFYLRPGFILKKARQFFQSPQDFIIGFFKLLIYVLSSHKKDDLI